MATLYVQQQGTKVRKKDNQLLVMKGEQTLETVPLAKLDQLVLMGRGVQISTALLVDLLVKGIPVFLTNQQGSKVYASLAQGVSRFGQLRSEQMQLVQTPARALELARAMIVAKLTNQRALLAETGWKAAAAAIAQIDQARASVVAAPTIDMVRGYEGAAAAAYFGAWRVELSATWGFNGRAYYPPPDPVNALLSFGYTLALSEVQAAVQLIGLDPYLGTFHVIEAGRPSLALDLLEEFRPLIVDRMVLELVRTGQIQRAQFERPAQRPGAVHLDAAGRALLVDRYETLLQRPARLPSGEQTPLRRVILLQAQALARVVRGEQERYVGYTPE
jgi:CRISPR-associated protein Cas1